MTRLDDVMERQRLELLRVENRAGASMVATYRDVLRRFEQRLAELQALIRQAEALGQQARAGWLFQQTRVIAMLGEYEQLVTGFVARAAGDIGRAEADAVELTARHVEQATLAALGPGPPDAKQQVATMFHRIPADTLERLVGSAADGRPLAMLLADLAPDGVERVRAALAFGVAAGRGPRQIARDMLAEARMPAARALLVARDQTLRAYREGMQARMAASDVVTGWRWHATLSERTCPMCLAMNGSLHADSEPMVTHPACRCTMIPVTPSWAQLGFKGIPDERPDVVDGPTLFARLPATEQKAILGPGAFAAYRAGALKLTDLVKQESTPFGPTLRRASLRELGLSRFAA